MRPGGWGPTRVSYNNPAYDRLFAERYATIALTGRQQIEVEMHKLIMEGLYIFPVYYNPLGSAVRSGLKGPAVPSDLNGSDEWNVHTWYFE